MHKLKFNLLGFLLLPLLLLSGCTPIGNKTASMTIIYIATAFLSFLLLIGYFFSIKKKENWFYVLFTSVLVVNIGYMMLAMSDTLDIALWANRIAYLGSVFLPLSMLKTIQKISKLKYPKWVNGVLISISSVVFLIAASPGWLDIYYKSVTLETIGGVSVLNKEYGSWHIIYLFYLLGYFTIMIATTIYAIVKKKIESTSHSIIILVAVFVNILVWLTEQLVRIDFEILSISYIITELFLISVYLMIQNQEKLIAALKAQTVTTSQTASSDLNRNSKEFALHCKFIVEQLPKLTPTERSIYNCYLDGKSTKEVLSELSIMENTLKFHNKNLYSKLGVTSRKQLIEYAKAILASDVKED
ncbi:MAG: hypothetical protein E7415_02400 [Ruminococcaceae bacterium]|nr:hypothetical protein [Oscillospiraceae bacterium]